MFMRTTSVGGLVSRWSRLEGGQERANYALFLRELTDALDLPPPEPAPSNYAFEFPVRGDAGQPLRIDLYRRDCFILEAKQSRLKPEKGEAPTSDDLFPAAPDARANFPRRPRWDASMRAAFGQAWDYANRLPAGHERPPFLLTCDVGRTFELYSDFTGQGRDYRPFERRKTIALEDLLDDEPRDLLRASGPPLAPSIPPWSAPASPARSPATSPRSRAPLKPRAGPRRRSPAFCRAACSPCSPRAWACCRPARSPACSVSAWSRPPAS